MVRSSFQEAQSQAWVDVRAGRLPSFSGAVVHQLFTAAARGRTAALSGKSHARACENAFLVRPAAWLLGSGICYDTLFFVPAVTPKLLGGPQVDRDRRLTQPRPRSKKLLSQRGSFMVNATAEDFRFSDGNSKQ